MPNTLTKTVYRYYEPRKRVILLGVLSTVYASASSSSVSRNRTNACMFRFCISRYRTHISMREVISEASFSSKASSSAAFVGNAFSKAFAASRIVPRELASDLCVCSVVWEW